MLQSAVFKFELQSLFDSQLFLGCHKVIPQVNILIESDQFLHSHVQILIEQT